MANLIFHVSRPLSSSLYSRTLRNQMLNIKNFLRFDSIICVGETTTTNEENQKKLNLIFHLTWSSRHSTYFQFVFFSQRNISPLFFHSSLSFDLLMSCRLSSKRNIAAKIFFFLSFGQLICLHFQQRLPRECDGTHLDSSRLTEQIDRRRQAAKLLCKCQRL